MTWWCKAWLAAGLEEVVALTRFAGEIRVVERLRSVAAQPRRGSKTGSWVLDGGMLESRSRRDQDYVHTEEKHVDGGQRCDARSSCKLSCRAGTITCRRRVASQRTKRKERQEIITYLVPGVAELINRDHQLALLFLFRSGRHGCWLRGVVRVVERGVLGSGRAEEAGRRWKFWRSGGMPGLCDGANGRLAPSPGLPFRRVTRNCPPAFCACSLLLCAKTAPSFAGQQPKPRRELFLRAVAVGNCSTAGLQHTA
jgi:hypothetical protein